MHLIKTQTVWSVYGMNWSIKPLVGHQLVQHSDRRSLQHEIPTHQGFCFELVAMVEKH